MQIRIIPRIAAEASRRVGPDPPAARRKQLVRYPEKQRAQVKIIDTAGLRRSSRHSARLRRLGRTSCAVARPRRSSPRTRHGRWSTPGPTETVCSLAAAAARDRRGRRGGLRRPEVRLRCRAGVSRDGGQSCRRGRLEATATSSGSRKRRICRARPSHKLQHLYRAMDFLEADKRTRSRRRSTSEWRIC